MVLQAGDILSERYEIETSIGEGAFGKVYRARHVLLHNAVAIKVLSNQMQQNQNVSKRFLREAQSVAAIDHPNVCRVLDFGELEDDAFFMVMEFLEGTPLDEYLSTHGWLNADEAIALTVQVCSALERVHSAGIVHRDIKPENLMLIPREDGSNLVKLVDFGIAGIIDPEEVDFPTAKLTRQGMIFGTPAYMSPEQSVSGQLDHRTDLYAIGCMLFEMLTGHPPYQAENITALLLKHVSEPIPNIQKHAPKPLPHALCLVIEQLLAKAATDRFESATALKSALLAVDATLTVDDRSTVGGLVTAPTPTPLSTETSFKSNETVPNIPPTVRPSRQKELLFIVGVIGVLIVMGLVGIVVVMVSGSSEKPQSTIAADSKVSRNKRKQLKDERDAFNAKPSIKKAIDLLETNPKASLTKLKSAASSFEGNPHMYFTLGLAHTKLKHKLDAAIAFSQAIALEPRYWHDTHTRDGLDLCLGSRKCAKSMKRVHLTLSKTGKLKGLWVARLSLNVREHKSRQVRRAAFSTLKNNNWLEQLPEWEREVVSLRGSRSCKAKLGHVKTLKSIGDKRALPALKYVSKRPRTGCGFLKRFDCLKCLRKPLANTIQTLE